MPLKVAIIGSGPSGFYAADAVLKAASDAQIDVIDRLPSPFGLIRAGIAPDHQGSKKIAKVFERTASEDNVRFFGNIEVGRDISIDELRDLYDAVILATGATIDRKLGIPGDDKKGVYGAYEFVSWYNAHPDMADLEVDLDTNAAAVIGVGNVALDVARVLAKSSEEMADSDLADHAAAVIHNSPLKDIYVFGRRGPLEAAFTHKEVRELGELEACVTLVDPEQLPDEEELDEIQDRGRANKEKNLNYLRTYSQQKPKSNAKRLHVVFFARPVEILGDDEVTGLRLEHTRVDDDGRCIGTGEFFEIECGLVVSCIGYTTEPIDGIPFDERSGHFKNVEGRIEKGLYAVGWAMRGPQGTVATNHPDGVQAAEKISQDIEPDDKDGGDGLLRLMQERGVRVVTFEDWKKIEAIEQDRAADGAPRRKFARIEDMISALD